VKFMTLLVFGAFLTLALSAAFSAQAAVDQKVSAFILCKNQTKDVRTIRITPDTKDDGCVTTYSKAGLDSVVSQNRSLTNCRIQMRNIQSKLEASQYTCRNVQKAQITYGDQVVR
jgi:hypothetical protein